MKHIPIGVIKQKQKFNKTIFYSVSLFEGRIRKSFETLDEAKSFCEIHIRSMLVEKEISALCVKYKRLDGFSSYIMYDFMWNEDNNDKYVANEYEETEFEFLDSHIWYKPYWKKAKIVDERSYCAGDVLRASMAKNPLVTIGYLFFSVLIFLSMIAGMGITFYLVNEYVIGPKWISNTLLLFMLVSLVIGMVLLMRPRIMLMKNIKSHERNFNEVDWKELFNKRKIFDYLYILFMLLTLLLTMGLLIHLNMASFSGNSTYDELRKTITAMMIIGAIKIFLFAFGRIYMFYKITKFVKHLFAISEYPIFKDWLKTTDPIWEFRTYEDFFIIPNEYSLEFVNREKIIVEHMIKSSDTQEIRVFGKRAVEHYKHSRKKHLDILRGKYVDIQ